MAMRIEATNRPKPVIGLTMGDPGGIGPEIIIKALADPAIRRLGRFVIYGLTDVLAYAADLVEIDPFWARIQHDSDRRMHAINDPVVVLDYDDFENMIHAPRRPTANGGRASKTFVEDAIGDALLPATDPRRLDAVVTAPIAKEAWHLAGFNWPGHTELFAHRTKTKRYTMMFVSPKLRVALATIHEPIVKLRDVLTIGRVFDPIDLGHHACQDLGIANPRIAVTGLNPHAGEGGAFGDEEIRIITPAIEMARNHGINVRGPFPGDTIFNDAVNGRYDLVVAMYHDQGLIPLKLLAWDEAVNWTVGLPIIRTSPDHGTAFSIAGRNKADARSIGAAIRLAADLAIQRHDRHPEASPTVPDHHRR
jgi:4-hydroxythreonine-4-phosphate dehydrogenase